MPKYPSMLNREPLLAPAPVLLRCLAVFHRFFTAVEDYSRADDKAGMLLIGYLADALHNVPGMLWHCDKADVWRTPDSMDAWMLDFPDHIRKKAAPERIIADGERILSAENSAQTLGARAGVADIVDLDLCPLREMRLYLDLIYHACLSMRMMRNYGRRPSVIHNVMDEWRDAYDFLVLNKTTYPARVHTPWRELEKAWTQDAQAQADVNRALAQILLSLPTAMVHRSSFDPAQFRVNLLAHIERPGSPHAAWTRLLET